MIPVSLVNYPRLLFSGFSTTPRVCFSQQVNYILKPTSPPWSSTVNAMTWCPVIDKAIVKVILRTDRPGICNKPGEYGLD